MLPPFVGLKGSNQPGAALQDSSEQACPCGELGRDGAAIGRCRCAAWDGRTLSTPSSAWAREPRAQIGPIGDRRAPW